MTEPYVNSMTGQERVLDAPFPNGMLEEIEAFLAGDDAPPGLDLYPKVFETQLFFPLQRQAELASMIRTARHLSPKVVMEIGADKGGGLYHWCKGLPTLERVIACEIRGTPYSHLFERAFPHLRFLWLEEDSTTASCGVKVCQFLNFKPLLDVLFIDGDKGSMERDFYVYRPLLSSNACVFFHDVQDKEPREAYQAVRNLGYSGKVLVDLSDTQRALERMHEGLPPANPHEGWLRHWRGRSCGVGGLFLGGK